jgi:hypothetical protein
VLLRFIKLLNAKAVMDPLTLEKIYDSIPYTSTRGKVG